MRQQSHPLILLSTWLRIPTRGTRGRSPMAKLRLLRRMSRLPQLPVKPQPPNGSTTLSHLVPMAARIVLR